MLTPRMMRAIQKIDFKNKYPKTRAENIIARANRIDHDMVAAARIGESFLRIELITRTGRWLQSDIIEKDEKHHQVLIDLYSELGYNCWSEGNDVIISWALETNEL